MTISSPSLSLRPRARARAKASVVMLAPKEIVPGPWAPRNAATVSRASHISLSDSQLVMNCPWVLALQRS